MRVFFWRHATPSAVEERDVWLRWMLDGGAKQSTVNGYRLITNKLLNRWPELHLGDFTDEHILGIIEEQRPPSRQATRGAFANLFGWAFRAKRIPHNPMHHVPTYKQPPQPPIEVFTEAERKALRSLPDPDGALMALLLGNSHESAGPDAALRPRFRMWWRARFPFPWMPYQICVPWQERWAEDGPYIAWRFRGRHWFKRPWPEGRTKETVMRYRAMKEAGEGPWAK